MSLETSSLHQTAVLWELSSYDSKGEPTVSAPEEISVRWEYVSALILSDVDAPVPRNGEVWLDQAVTPGSILWKGCLEDLPDPATDLYEVIQYDEVPDVKGRFVERIATVRRYRNSLPTVV